MKGLPSVLIGMSVVLVQLMPSSHAVVINYINYKKGEYCKVLHIINM